MKSHLDRVTKLIEFAREVMKSRYSHGVNIISADSVQTEMFSELRTSSLSFIKGLYKENHPFYTDFDKKVHIGHAYEIEIAIGILLSIKSEIENGWIISLKGLVSAEIFTDFIEMAEHLLVEGYKDPAAVMIGCVLEEHLRQLCIVNKIETFDSKGKPKKADLLNSELTSAVIYNRLDQKNVTTWLDLRNKAAHGLFGEYNQDQVELMIRGVIEFMSRNPIT
jgi:hypothetical protein